MTAAEDLFRELTEGNIEPDGMTVETAEDRVRIEGGNVETLLDPDEARSFADDLEAHGEEEGWYHTGGTKPFLEEIRETAEEVS